MPQNEIRSTTIAVGDNTNSGGSLPAGRQAPTTAIEDHFKERIHKTKNGSYSLSIRVTSDFLLQFGEDARRADEVRGLG